MLEKHYGMCDGSLGEIRATCHRLLLVARDCPHWEMPRRTGLESRRKIAGEVRKLLNAGVIGPDAGEYTSPGVLVSKKHGFLCFCVDYPSLNMKTMTESYPLPRMDDGIDSLGHTAVFNTLECNSRYWQIAVDPSDRDKTTFTTHCCTFRYKRMPFGVKNAPATFQRALDTLLSGVR